MAMKPVPKAILIAAVVAATAYGGMKFLPKHPATAQAPADTTVVAPPTADAVQAAQPPATPPSIPNVEVQPLPQAPAQAATETPHLNTSSGDAGLAAVLGAGKK